MFDRVSNLTSDAPRKTPIKVLMKLSEILKERLKDKNLSAVARSLGIPKTLLHEWTHAKRVPSFANIEHLVVLAAYLNISLEELLVGTPPSDKVISSITFNDHGRKYRVRIERIG
jgi:hypothetical protein